jgi:hypothetical protein
LVRIVCTDPFGRFHPTKAEVLVVGPAPCHGSSGSAAMAKAWATSPKVDGTLAYRRDKIAPGFACAFVFVPGSFAKSGDFAR